MLSSEELEDLLESWINGNRRHVVDTILDRPHARAAHASAQFIEWMASSLDSRGQTGVFLRLLEARAEGE